MLKEQIILTLKFFDIQDMPLTLFELHKFLLADMGSIKNKLDNQWELREVSKAQEQVPIDMVAKMLETQCHNETECHQGYYCLRGRGEIIVRRLSNYSYGIKRERRIRRFLGLLAHLPFVRGVAVGGSQALGQQKEGSDIDLLIVTKGKYMWLCRTLISAFFHLLRMRRHGEMVANRFCLNHYLAKPKAVDRERNLYKAMEYGRLRPLVYPQNLHLFLQENLAWIKVFFPNIICDITPIEPQSKLQYFLEKILGNSFGQFLEHKLKNMELPRIQQDDYTFVLDDELSFHPSSRHGQLLERFFK